MGGALCGLRGLPSAGAALRGGRAPLPCSLGPRVPVVEVPPVLLGDVGSRRNHARQHVAVDTSPADLTVAFAWQPGVADRTDVLPGLFPLRTGARLYL